MMVADYNVHCCLRRDGHALAIEPAARARHQNFERLIDTLRVGFIYSRTLAAGRARIEGWGRARRLRRSITILATAPLARFGRLALATVRRPRRLLALALYSPAVLTVYLLSAAGESAGYLLAPAASPVRSSIGRSMRNGWRTRDPDVGHHPRARRLDDVAVGVGGPRPQVEQDGREVLLVDSSGEVSEAELQRRWPWVRIEALDVPALPGKARNIGTGVAQGELLAFLDADCVPAAGWLDALEAALIADADAVGGSIVNGTPGSAVGTAGYLLEFADWLPDGRHSLRHAASCNLLIRRSVLDRAGGFAEDVFPGEDTILTVPLAAGGRLAFAPAARVRHLNRTSLGQFIRHQRRLGRAFAQVCQRSDFPHRRLGRPALAPLAGSFRLLALTWRLIAHPRQAIAALVLLPLLLLGLGGWTIGLAGAARPD